MNERPKLYLIDGTAIAYRAHFGMVRNPLYTQTGFPTSAVFGFFRSLFKILREEKPNYLAAIFDSKEKTFRHEIYPKYKATRERMPDELRDQIPVILKILEAMYIPSLVIPGYEADDVIGTLARKYAREGMETYLVTGDKDFMQLVDRNIYLYKPPVASKSLEIITPEKVEQQYGVPPQRIIDWLALTGDQSDNIPGVKGVGTVNATKLLKQWKSLENLLDNIDKISKKSIREKLEQGKEDALLSRKLVTIDTQVPLNISEEQLRLKPFEPEKVTPLFSEYELYSLIEELKQFSAKSEKKAKEYISIDSPEKLEDLIKKLRKQPIFAVDTETTGKDPITSRVIGISFCWEADKAYYIPFDFKDKTYNLFSEKDSEFVLSKLKPVLESSEFKKIGQNLKYDIQVLQNHGIEMQGLQFDTMIAAFLLNPDARSYKLDILSQQYLNYIMQPIEELIGKKGSRQLSMTDVQKDSLVFYAAEDADITFQLYQKFAPELERTQLEHVFYSIEMPLVPVLVRMERNGVYLDTEKLREQSEELGKKIDAVKAEIYQIAGETFNLNSPKQLAEILFDRIGLQKVRKRSTDVNVLEKLKHKHPLPEKILEYRTLTKLKNTYLDALPAQINPETGRVHSSFNQTVAATGRLSSSNPNFQNIPIRTELGREIRKAFVPENAGDFILSADYSQIELRVMAHISGDENLRRAFQEGIDIHSQTASIVYGVPLKDVLPEMRRTAKVVNFGIMYGAGPFRMSEELGISLQEAEVLIEDYFRKFPGINAYIFDTLEFARRKKYVKTLAGRRRYLPNIDVDNRRQREAAERMAINMPIQGTAADMIKIAMARIYNEMKSRNMKSKMILQIHDELLFEVVDNELEDLQKLIKINMEEALPLDVPVIVDIGIGKSWYEAH